MQGPSFSEKVSRAELQPAAQFFNSTLAKANQIAIDPTTLRRIVSALFVDAWLEV